MIVTKDHSSSLEIIPLCFVKQKTRKRKENEMTKSTKRRRKKKNGIAKTSSFFNNSKCN
jgi:hypothetical protein